MIDGYLILNEMFINPPSYIVTEKPEIIQNFTKTKELIFSGRFQSAEMTLSEIITELKTLDPNTEGLGDLFDEISVITALINFYRGQSKSTISNLLQIMKKPGISEIFRLNARIILAEVLRDSSFYDQAEYHLKKLLESVEILRVTNAIEISQLYLIETSAILIHLHVSIGKGDYFEINRLLEFEFPKLELNLPSQLIGHPILCRIQIAYAASCQLQGSLDESIQLYSQALTFQLNYFPSNHPLLAETYVSIASVNLQLGNIDEAKSKIDIGLPSLSRCYVGLNSAAHHPTLTYSYYIYALLQITFGNYFDAKYILDQVLESHLLSYPFELADIPSSRPTPMETSIYALPPTPLELETNSLSVDFLTSPTPHPRLALYLEAYARLANEMADPFSQMKASQQASYILETNFPYDPSIYSLANISNTTIPPIITPPPSTTTTTTTTPTNKKTKKNKTTTSYSSISSSSISSSILPVKINPRSKFLHIYRVQLLVTQARSLSVSGHYLGALRIFETLLPPFLSFLTVACHHRTPSISPASPRNLSLPSNYDAASVSLLSFPHTHPILLQILLEMAHCSLRLGKFAIGKEWLSHAYKMMNIKNKNSKNLQPSTSLMRSLNEANFLFLLGLYYREAHGQYHSSLAALSRCLLIRIFHYGKTHLIIAETLESYLQTLRSIGNFKESAEISSFVFSIRSQLLNPVTNLFEAHKKMPPLVALSYLLNIQLEMDQLFFNRSAIVLTEELLALLQVVKDSYGEQSLIFISGFAVLANCQIQLTDFISAEYAIFDGLNLIEQNILTYSHPITSPTSFFLLLYLEKYLQTFLLGSSYDEIKPNNDEIQIQSLMTEQEQQPPSQQQPLPQKRSPLLSFLNSFENNSSREFEGDEGEEKQKMLLQLRRQLDIKYSETEPIEYNAIQSSFLIAQTVFYQFSSLIKFEEHSPSLSLDILKNKIVPKYKSLYSSSASVFSVNLQEDPIYLLTTHPNIVYLKGQIGRCMIEIGKQTNHLVQEENGVDLIKYVLGYFHTRGKKREKLVILKYKNENKEEIDNENENQSENDKQKVVEAVVEEEVDEFSFNPEHGGWKDFGLYGIIHNEGEYEHPIPLSPQHFENIDTFFKDYRVKIFPFPFLFPLSSFSQKDIDIFKSNFSLLSTTLSPTLCQICGNLDHLSEACPFEFQGRRDRNRVWWFDNIPWSASIACSRLEFNAHISQLDASVPRDEYGKLIPKVKMNHREDSHHPSSSFAFSSFSAPSEPTRSKQISRQSSFPNPQSSFSLSSSSADSQDNSTFTSSGILNILSKLGNQLEGSNEDEDDDKNIIVVEEGPVGDEEGSEKIKSSQVSSKVLPLQTDQSSSTTSQNDNNANISLESLSLLTPRSKMRQNFILATGFLFERARELIALGWYSKAVPFILECVRGLTTYLPQSEKLSDAFLLQGENYTNIGKYELAMESFKKSFLVRKKLFTEKSPQVMEVVVRMGEVFVEESNFQKAEEYFQKVIKYRKKTLTKETNLLLVSIELTSTLNMLNLGNTPYETKKMAEKSLSTLKKLKSPGKDLLKGMWCLAECLRYCGLAFDGKVHLEQAIGLMKQYVAQLIQNPGNESDNPNQSSQLAQHPYLADLYFSLTLNIFDQGGIFEARKRLNHVREIREIYFPSDDRRIAQAIYTEACFDCLCCDYEISLMKHEKALSIRQVCFPIPSPNTTNETPTTPTTTATLPAIKPILHIEITDSLLGMAQVYLKLGNFNKARELCLQVVTSRTERFGSTHPFHPKISEAVCFQGEIELCFGDYEKAEKLIKSSLDMRIAIFGTEHQLSCQSQRLLADLARAKGDYEQAIPLYQQNIKFLTAIRLDEHFLFAQNSFGLAHALRMVERYEEADVSSKNALSVTKMMFTETENKSYFSLMECMHLNALLLLDQARLPTVATSSEEEYQREEEEGENDIENETEKADENENENENEIENENENENENNDEKDEKDEKENVDADIEREGEEYERDERQEEEGEEEEEEISPQFQTTNELFQRDETGAPIFNNSIFQAAINILKEILELSSSPSTSSFSNPKHPHPFLSLVKGDLGIAYQLEYQAKIKFISTLRNADRRSFQAAEKKFYLDQGLDPPVFELDANLKPITPGLLLIHEARGELIHYPLHEDQKHEWIQKLTLQDSVVLPVDEMGLAREIFQVGVENYEKGNFYESIAKLDEAFVSQVDYLTPFKAASNNEVADTLYYLASNYYLLGDFVLSKRLFDLSILIWRKFGSFNFIDNELEKKEPTATQQELQYQQDMKSLEGLSRALSGLGNLLKAEGKYLDSKIILDQVMELRLQLYSKHEKIEKKFQSLLQAKLKLLNPSSQLESSENDGSAKLKKKKKTIIHPTSPTSNPNSLNSANNDSQSDPTLPPEEITAEEKEQESSLSQQRFFYHSLLVESHFNLGVLSHDLGFYQPMSTHLSCMETYLSLMYEVIQSLTLFISDLQSQIDLLKKQMDEEKMLAAMITTVKIKNNIKNSKNNNTTNNEDNSNNKYEKLKDQQNDLILQQKKKEQILDSFQKKFHFFNSQFYFFQGKVEISLLGRYQVAFKSFEQSFEILSMIVPQNHYSLSEIYHWKAECEYLLGNYGKARNLSGKALNLRIENFGMSNDPILIPYLAQIEEFNQDKKPPIKKKGGGEAKQKEKEENPELNEEEEERMILKMNQKKNQEQAYNEIKLSFWNYLEELDISKGNQTTVVVNQKPQKKTTQKKKKNKKKVKIQEEKGLDEVELQGEGIIQEEDGIENDQNETSPFKRIGVIDNNENSSSLSPTSSPASPSPHDKTTSSTPQNEPLPIRTRKTYTFIKSTSFAHFLIAETAALRGKIALEFGNYLEAQELFETSLSMRKEIASNLFQFKELHYHPGLQLTSTSSSPSTLSPSSSPTMTPSMSPTMSPTSSFSFSSSSSPSSHDINFQLSFIDTSDSLYFLGEMAVHVGSLSDALELHSESLNQRSQFLLENHPKRAESIRAIARIKHILGKYQESELLCLDALKIYQSQSSLNPPLPPTQVTFQIGSTSSLSPSTSLPFSKQQQQFIRSTPSSSEGLALPESHPLRISLALERAKLLISQYFLNEALSLLTKTIQLFQPTFGEIHPLMPALLFAKSEASFHLGKFDVALSNIEKSFSICIQIYGEEHTITFQSLFFFAKVLYQLGKIKESQRIFEKIIQFQKSILGKNHYRTAMTLIALGEILSESGSYKQAKKTFIRAGQILKKTLGGDHFAVANCMVQLGKTLQSEGDFQNAQEKLLNALAMRRRIVQGCDGEGKEGVISGEEENHLEIAHSLFHLGEFNYSIGEFEESLHFHETSLTIRRNKLGSMHYLVAQSLESIGKNLFQKGEFGVSLNYHERVYSLRQSLIAPDHPDFLQSHFNLALMTRNQGKLEIASSTFERLILHVKSIHGMLHPQTALFFYQLAVTYNLSGRYQSAYHLFLQALKIRLFLFEEYFHHPLILEVYAGIAENLLLRGICIPPSQSIEEFYKPPLSTSASSSSLSSPSFISTSSSTTVPPLLSLDNENNNDILDPNLLSEQQYEGDYEPEKGESLVAISVLEFNDADPELEQSITENQYPNNQNIGETDFNLHSRHTSELNSPPQPVNFTVGTQVLANFQQKGNWFSAVILDIQQSPQPFPSSSSSGSTSSSISSLSGSGGLHQGSENYHLLFKVEYDDGEIEEGLTVDSIQLTQNDNRAFPVQIQSPHQSTIDSSSTSTLTPLEEKIRLLKAKGELAAALKRQELEKIEEENARRIQEEAKQLAEQEANLLPNFIKRQNEKIKNSAEETSSINPLKKKIYFFEESEMTSSLSMYEQILDAQLSYFSETHPQVLKTRLGIAESLRIIGRVRESRKLLLDILAKHRRKYGEQNLEMVEICIFISEGLKSMSKLYQCKSLEQFNQTQILARSGCCIPSQAIQDLSSILPGGKFDVIENPHQNSILGHSQSILSPPKTTTTTSNSVTLRDHLTPTRSKITHLVEFKPSRGYNIPRTVSHLLDGTGLLESKDGKGKYPKKLKSMPTTEGYMGYQFQTPKKLLGQGGNTQIFDGKIGPKLPDHVYFDDADWTCDVAINSLKKIFSSQRPIEHPFFAHLLYLKGECKQIRKKELNSTTSSPPQQSSSITTASTTASTPSPTSSTSEALQFFEKSISMSRHLYLGKHPLIAKCLFSMAEIQRANQKHFLALALYQQAIDMLLLCFGSESNHPFIDEITSNMSLIHFQLGKLEEATQLLEKNLYHRQCLFGPLHPSVAYILVNLASIYQTQGDLNSAKHFSSEALKIRQKIYGESNVEVAASMNNLGLILKSLGEFHEAEKMHLKALEIQRSLLPCEHQDIASSLHNLASLYTSQSRFTEAREIYKETLELKKKLFGYDHPSLASTLNNYASLLFQTGDLTSAQEMYQDALRIRLKIFHENHPSVAETMNNLALLLVSLNSFQEAFPYFEKSYEIKKLMYGEGHPMTISALRNLEKIKIELKKGDSIENDKD